MKFRIRKADIPKDHREIFERYGPDVIGTVLAGGFTPSAKDLQPLHPPNGFNMDACKWMTEQYDRAERWETWSLIMEIAITAFVFVEMSLSLVHFFMEMSLSVLQFFFRIGI